MIRPNRCPRTPRLASAFLCAFVACAADPGGAQAPRFPYPQHLPGPAGTILPAHESRTQLDADVAAAYDRWKSAHLLAAGVEPDGHPRYRIRHAAGANPDTVSEGQGYGLVIVALMAGHDAAARTLFDGLVEYARDHRSVLDARLMDWNVPANEAANPPDDDCAFDGDADIALGLLLAERQWGNSGRIDYRAEALSVLAGLEQSALGPASHLPLLGDWVDPDGSTYNQRTVRTSDFMPGHFRAFAVATGDAGWQAAVTSVAAVAAALRAGYAPATGLLPDFTVPVSSVDPSPQPAPPDFLEGATDGDYSYNAGRVPWRFASDALLSQSSASRTTALAISAWARTATAGVPTDVRAGYRLNGTALPDSDYFSTFFVAPLGAAARLDPAHPAWLEAIFEAVKLEQQGYYEDSVTLLSLLVMSGNFWTPDRAGLLFLDAFETGDLAGWSAAATTAADE
jgi:endo-1,4-beta-D-glucanase Y